MKNILKALSVVCLFIASACSTEMQLDRATQTAAAEETELSIAPAQDFLVAHKSDLERIALESAEATLGKAPIAVALHEAESYKADNGVTAYKVSFSAESHDASLSYIVITQNGELQTVIDCQSAHCPCTEKFNFETGEASCSCTPCKMEISRAIPD